MKHRTPGKCAMIHPALSKDLPGRTVDCLSPSEAPRRPTTEEPQRSRPQARGHSLRCPIVVYRCLERPAGPQNAPEIRQSSPRANATRLEERSPLAGMDNLGSRSAPSEATKTQEERSESSQRDLVHCGGWMLEYSGFQCEDDAKKSDHNIADTEADFVPRPSGSSDRVRKTWTTSRTASRLMAKTAILAAAPICNLVVSNYAHAHGLLLSPTSERLSGNGSCRYQVSTILSVQQKNPVEHLLIHRRPSSVRRSHGLTVPTRYYCWQLPWPGDH